MKRLISILVIATMLLASVMAMIPASAETTVDYASETTYNVNWAKLYTDDKMQTRWRFDPDKKVYEEFYKVTAEGNYITSEATDAAKNNNDVHLSYYSTEMFEISDDTYYEYTFSAKTDDANPTGYAGIVFAYGGDKYNLYQEGDKGSQETVEGTYILFGGFQNESDDDDNKFSLDLYYGEYDGYSGGANHYCINDGAKAIERGKDDAYNYNTFKIVYDGYDVTFFYLAESGEFEQMFEHVDLELPEDASVCVGMYNRGKERYIHIKDATITYNGQTAAILAEASDAKIGLAAALDTASAVIANPNLELDYTSETVTALNEAIAAAKLVYADETKEDADFISAAEALEAAIAGLEAKPIDYTDLLAKYYELKYDEEYIAIFTDEANDWLAKAEELLDNPRALISEVEALITEYENLPSTDAFVAVDNNGVSDDGGIDFKDMTADGKYILANDIEISETYDEFKGYLDGKGHTITINATNCGVFSKINGATIKNIVINSKDNAVLTPSVGDNAGFGALACSAKGVVRIENVTNNASISVNQGRRNIAGFIGVANGDLDISFIGCVNNAEIIGGRTAGFFANVNSGTCNFYFYNCVNKKNISCGASVSTNPAAGFLARTTDGNTESITFEYCANFGNINSKYGTGAFFGCGLGDVYINGCYNEGNIIVSVANSTTRPIGGFVGGSNKEDKAAYNITVTNSIQNGNVIVNENYETCPAAILVGGTYGGEVYIENVIVNGIVATYVGDNNAYKITANDSAHTTIKRVYGNVSFVTIPTDTTATFETVLTDYAENTTAIGYETELNDIDFNLYEDEADYYEFRYNQQKNIFVAAQGTTFAAAKEEATENFFGEVEFYSYYNTLSNVMKILGQEKEPDLYTEESYEAYDEAYDDIINELLYCGEDELVTLDIEALKAAAEAKLVTLAEVAAAAEAAAKAEAEAKAKAEAEAKAAAEASFKAAKEVALRVLGAKKENVSKIYTEASYTTYAAAYDALRKQIEDAATLEAVNAIDVDALKVEAEAKLAIEAPKAEADTNTGANNNAEVETDANANADANAGDAAASEGGCGGCGSSAAISAIAIVGVIGSAIALKKKED